MPETAVQLDVPLSIQDFSGGFSSDPRQNELREAKNVEMTRDGSMKSRLGYAAVGAQITGAPAMLGVFDFTRFSGTLQFLALHSGNLRQYNTSTQVWDLKSAFGGTQTQRFRMVEYKDEFVYANPDKLNPFAPRRWNGTTDQAVTGAPVETQHLLVAHNMLFMAKDHRLSFTDVDSWNIPSTNWIDVAPQDGTKITGLSLFQGNIVIWKHGGHHVLFGREPGSFVLQPVSRQAGNEAEDGPIAEKNTLFLLQEGRPVVWTGGRFSRIARQLTADFKSLIGAYDGERLMLWNGTDSRVYVYNEAYGHWTRFGFANGINCINYFRTQNLSGQTPGIYFGTNDGKVFQFGTGSTDGGITISTVVQPEDQDMGQPEVVKEVRRVYVEGTGTSVSADLISTYGSGSSVTTALRTGLTLPAVLNCPPNYGTRHTVKVTGVADLEVTKILMYMRAHRMRQ